MLLSHVIEVTGLSYVGQTTRVQFCTVNQM